MGRKKSFTSEAFSTITGTNVKEAKSTAPETTNQKIEVEAAKPEKVAQKPKKDIKIANGVEAISSRSKSRTGKPVTLYLNTTNYQLFKTKLKEENKTASAAINEFILGYLS